MAETEDEPVRPGQRIFMPKASYRSLRFLKLGHSVHLDISYQKDVQHTVPIDVNGVEFPLIEIESNAPYIFHHIQLKKFKADGDNGSHRRSSRQSNVKSARELLGLSPRKSQDKVEGVKTVKLVAELIEVLDKSEQNQSYDDTEGLNTPKRNTRSAGRQKSKVKSPSISCSTKNNKSTALKRKTRGDSILENDGSNLKKRKDDINLHKESKSLITETTIGTEKDVSDQEDVLNDTAVSDSTRLQNTVESCTETFSVMLDTNNTDLNTVVSPDSIQHTVNEIEEMTNSNSVVQDQIESETFIEEENSNKTNQLEEEVPNDNYGDSCDGEQITNSSTDGIVTSVAVTTIAEANIYEEDTNLIYTAYGGDSEIVQSTVKLEGNLQDNVVENIVVEYVGDNHPQYYMADINEQNTQSSSAIQQQLYQQEGTVVANSSEVWEAINKLATTEVQVDDQNQTASAVSSIISFENNGTFIAEVVQNEDVLKNLVEEAPRNAPQVDNLQQDMVNDDIGIQEEGKNAVEQDVKNTFAVQPKRDIPILRASMGFRKQITNSDIVQEGFTAKGTHKPQEQLLIMPEFVKLIDTLEADDDIDSHVIRCARGKGSKDDRKKPHLECKYCGIPIKSKHHFRRHIITHPDIIFRPWKCPLCDYRALIKPTIKKHINIHSSVKPYICNDCGRGFNFKQKLQQHMKYHNDVRDYYCPFCSLSFHEIKTLKNHVRHVHHIQNPTEFLKTQHYRAPKPIHLSSNEIEQTTYYIHNKEYNVFENKSKMSKTGKLLKKTPSEDTQALSFAAKTGNKINLEYTGVFVEDSLDGSCMLDHRKEANEEVIIEEIHEIDEQEGIIEEVVSEQSNMTGENVISVKNIRTGEVMLEECIKTAEKVMSKQDIRSVVRVVSEQDIKTGDKMVSEQDVTSMDKVTSEQEIIIEDKVIPDLGWRRLDKLITDEDIRSAEESNEEVQQLHEISSTNEPSYLIDNVDERGNVLKEGIVQSASLSNVDIVSLENTNNETQNTKTSSDLTNTISSEKLTNEIESTNEGKVLTNTISTKKPFTETKSRLISSVVTIPKIPVTMPIVNKNNKNNTGDLNKTKPRIVYIKLPPNTKIAKIPVFKNTPPFNVPERSVPVQSTVVKETKASEAMVTKYVEGSTLKPLDTMQKSECVEAEKYETTDSECDVNDEITYSNRQLNTSETPTSSEVCHVIIENNQNTESNETFDRNEEHLQEYSSVISFQDELATQESIDTMEIGISGDNNMVHTEPMYRAKQTKLYGTHKIKANTRKFQGNAEYKNYLPVIKTEKSFTQHSEGIRENIVGRGKKVYNIDQVDEGVRQYLKFEKDQVFKWQRKFSCVLCENEGEKKFSVRIYSKFLDHLFCDHPLIKPFKCTTCGFLCRSKANLISHKKQHGGTKSHVCNICGKGFLFSQKLKVHMRTHENLRQHMCNLCSNAFNEKSDLNRHFRKVHLKEKNIRCPHCGKGFFDVAELKRHIETHNETKEYCCSYCQKMYQTRTSLSQHMKSHICMFHCEICNRDFGSYSGFMAHKVMHDESTDGYVCAVCNKTLTTKGSLKRHMSNCHSDERPFKCATCDKTFKSKKDLQGHSVAHNDDKVYVCEVCTFSSKRLDSLKVHMRRHSIVKPFQCGVCKKEYTQKGALEQHLVQHTGKSFVCEVCNQRFVSKNLFNQHMMKKHVPSQLKEQGENTGNITVYMCEQCKAIFVSQDDLAGHILSDHMKQGLGPLYMESNEDNSGVDGSGGTFNHDAIECEVVTEGTNEEDLDTYETSEPRITGVVSFIQDRNVIQNIIQDNMNQEIV